MLEVMFIKSPVDEIKNFQKMPLQEACRLTYQLEQKFQEQQRIVNLDFHILDQASEEMYAGTLSLGSSYASHLYEHVENKLSSMDLDEEQEKQKEQLLQLMQEDIASFLQEIAPPEEEEEPQKEQTRRERAQQNEETVSFYSEKEKKKHILHILGGVIGGVVVGAVGMFSFYTFPSTTAIATTNQLDTSLVKGLQQASIQQYTKAVQEFKKVNYKEQDKDSQKSILFSYLLSGEPNTALKLEPQFAESVVAYYVGINNIKKINEIDVKNDVIDFEKASLNQQYEKVIQLKEKVLMDGRREKLIVEAYMNLKQYDECFAFAKSQGNQELMREVKELEKQEIEQSDLSDEKKQEKMQEIDKELSSI